MKPLTITLSYLIAGIVSFGGDFKNDSVVAHQQTDASRTLALSKVESVSLSDGYSTYFRNEIFNFMGGVKFFILLLYIGPISIIVGISIRNRNFKNHIQQPTKKGTLQNPDSDSKSLVHCKLPLQAKQKARELTSYSLAIIQKQNVLAQVRNEIFNLTQLPDSVVSRDSSVGKKFDSLLETAAADQRNYWDDFLSSFQMLYPNYFVNIRSKVFDITDRELKLAALLRLGLDTKKIAALLNLSPESVKVFRHRLRKRMELTEDASLYNSLAHFDETHK